MTGSALSVAFFLQMLVILAACRFVGAAVRRFGQPPVIGEMIAGIVLGPSLFGLMFPGLQQQLFPRDSLKVLYVGAQLGVGLYMFLVGLEFDTQVFRRRARSAASVSVAGMAVPFSFAIGLAPWLLGMPGLFSAKTGLFEAILFLGASMAITAFPILARIIHERGLTGSPIGTLTLAAGAIDDAGAWTVLAIVLASVQQLPDGRTDWMVAVRAIGGGAAYALVTCLAGRRLLAPLGRAADQAGQVNGSLLSVVLMLFCFGAWAMDAIGIHAVFGGFLLGVAMPRGLLTKQLQQKLVPLSVTFLLPMFFTFSGLNTRLDLVNSPRLMLIALVLLVASIVGKGGACWAAARLHGEDNRSALAIGTLMNARGLMELILLNIGLEKGIIEPALFSMLVPMAIITTLMTAPLFEWVYGRHLRQVDGLTLAPTA